MNGDSAEPEKQKSISVWGYIALGAVVTLFLLALKGSHHATDDIQQHCINNLRQIDGAKQQWAMETKALSNAVPSWDNIQPYLGRGTGGTLPVCPAGGIYTIGSLTNAPTCSIKGHALE